MKLIKQEEYCKKINEPMFAPRDGKCYHCNRQLTDKGDQLITGCEHCNRSYVD